jgi:glycosyltransferase involved in cell wall biosynthesis
MRLAFVANMPTPYRDSVYERLASIDSVQLLVIYCQSREPNRHWALPAPKYNARILGTRAIPYGGQYIQVGRGVWRELDQFQPDVVFTTGYGPVMLQAFAWCLVRKLPHIAFSDGIPITEAHLSRLHRLLRRLVFSRTAAFAGASVKTLDLFRSYGVADQRLFQSCLCVENGLYAPSSKDVKAYDVLFSGRFAPVKMPLFFLDVVEAIAQRQGRCRAAMLGAGPLEKQIRTRVKTLPDLISVDLPGFVQPAELPAYYRRSKILLFPSKHDPWGVVANEAAAAGLPIITTPCAGAAGELVKDQSNGFVLEPDVDAWATAAAELLGNAERYATMSRASLDIVADYNPKAAAEGLHRAASFARASQIKRGRH